MGLKRSLYSVDADFDIEVVLFQDFSDALDQTVFFKCGFWVRVEVLGQPDDGIGVGVDKLFEPIAQLLWRTFSRRLVVAHCLLSDLGFCR
ncbi:hypothetical protein FRC0505_01992 [Corynebacterium diphtheriae]|nr:hypothetical protein FRC0505_01992 [Corynebacterium diphtheriae]